eukprot:CAMPEP_0172319184 /NCGR_PEP_ID=MMETSP1058-20130122/37042_1 /TAXON_ID=83371 /ORGANISM="Detonula confervacea, Strain CCMP 353" /LENGTH=644 /DNA_ID=CAMNT_0013034181 /DNA_START=140 /DNA_END=2074 /DNA_ORIENTATION=+
MTVISSILSDQKEERSCCHGNDDDSYLFTNLQDAPSAFNLRNIFAVSLIAVMGILGLASHNLHHTDIEPLDRMGMNHQRLHSNNHHYSQLEEYKGEPVQLHKNEEAQQHRLLWSLSNFFDPKSVVLRKPFVSSDVSNMAVETYDHQNVIITARAFRRELFLLYYDPVEDAFRIYVDEKKDKYQSPVWSPSWNRLRTIMPTLSFALRNHFADRFQGLSGGSPELLLFVSTGDISQLMCDCVNQEERLKRPNFCQNEKFAPILQFGSVYKDTKLKAFLIDYHTTILPTVVPMPIWTHMPCFTEWQMEGSVCQEIKLGSEVAGKLGGQEALIADASAGELKQMPFSVWDTLIPTLIWRGSNFYFLTCLHPGVRPVVDWAKDIAPRMALLGNHARGVIDSLLELWDNLTPRWRAAALTAMANLEAEEMSETKGEESERDDAHIRQRSQTEWIDAKFTIKSNSDGTVDQKITQYQPFQEYGIQLTDEHMSLSQLSKYKYHIDLGGGGGTTWFGTIEKLGMPGVLLHHCTSAKDYFHDDLVPWVHYIPVNEDLSNLKEMYDWAEANNEDARKISEAGTEYVKNRAKPSVMKATYERYFVHSLKNVVDAYLPIEGDDAKKEMEGWLSKWSLVGKCSGKDEKCELMDWRVTE